MKYIIKDFYKRLLLLVLTIRSEQRNEVEFKHFLCLYFLTVNRYTKFFSVTWRTSPGNLHNGFGTSFGKFVDNAFTVKEIT